MTSDSGDCIVLLRGCFGDIPPSMVLGRRMLLVFLVGLFLLRRLVDVSCCRLVVTRGITVKA